MPFHISSIKHFRSSHTLLATHWDLSRVLACISISWGILGVRCAQKAHGTSTTTRPDSAAHHFAATKGHVRRPEIYSNLEPLLQAAGATAATHGTQ